MRARSKRPVRARSKGTAKARLTGTASAPVHAPSRLRFLGLAGIALVTLGAVGGCASDDSAQPSAVAVGPADETSAPATPPSPTLEPNFTPPEPVTSPFGLTVQVGPVEAALGHRASVVTLTNDGEQAVTVDGYPEVRILDADGQDLGVRTEHDSSYMAIDPGPAPVSIAPGEQVLSVISWSATVTDPDAVDRGAYVVVTTMPGEPQQTFPLDADLGSTGELSVTAWATELVE